MTTLNIIELLERNPLTRLNKDYQNRLISKIQDNFREEEQQLFLTSFFCYLNYDSKKDFIIDFDNVWKWCGFSRKDSAKKILDKHFTENIDYEVFRQVAENSLQGGRPVERIMLTIHTFKKFCLKANTKKADEIHEYYIKLEEILHETITEENAIIRNQLTEKQNTENILINKLADTEHKYLKLQENHNRILYKRRLHKLRKGKCFYIVENTGIQNEKKIGITNNLNVRRSSYRTYFDPKFLYIIFTKYYTLIETCVKVRFREHVKINCDEWLINVPTEDIINFVETLCKTLNIEEECESYKKIEDIIVDTVDENSKEEEKKEEEEEMNDEYNFVIEDDDKEEDKDDDNQYAEFIFTKPKKNIKKKEDDIMLDENEKYCTGCETIKTLDNFNKDSTKKDGRHTRCRECEKERKRWYKEEKQLQVEAENITEKECASCLQVKDIIEFGQHLYTKDGYNRNCKECCRNKDNARRKLDKDNNVKYSCEYCDKTYSRKDTFSKHKRNCVKVEK